jgi:hypothetical protein
MSDDMVSPTWLAPLTLAIIETTADASEDEPLCAAAFMPGGKIEYYRGRAINLNPVVLRRQRVNEGRYQILVKTHEIKIDLIDIMEQEDPVRDRHRLLKYADLLDKLQAIQQAFWGFPLDPVMRMFWIAPHCSCPKGRNDRLWTSGSRDRIYDPTCIFHGEHDGCALGQW